MKSAWRIWSTVLIVAMVCAGCDQEPAYTVSLDANTLWLTEGDMHSLTAETQAPEVEWTSDDEAVATVFHGVVTATGIGHTKITATVDGGEKGVCTVYVTGKDGKTMRLNPSYVVVEKGEVYSYSYAVSYDLPLVWRSSNPDVATVDEMGTVTALKGGRTTISLSNGADSCTSNFVVQRHWGAYKQVWSDEFEGSSLNTEIWSVENTASVNNSEKQCYTNRTENVRVEDGNLVIQLRKEEYQMQGVTRQYTSGRINSKHKKAFRYGKMEARIYFPSGVGTWPAFWMMGENGGWPKCGEIDIVEHVGKSPSFVSFALHTQAKNGDKGNNWHAGDNFDHVEDNYHVYGIEWLEEEKFGCDVIHFTYDGEVYATAQEDMEHIDENYYWPFNQEYYFILNMAVGGSMGGPTIDDTMFDKDVVMKVDWVRVYQREETE